MLPIKMSASTEGNKKLTPIRFRAGIRHTENTSLVMGQRGVEFILEFLAPDGFAARAILTGVVAALDHEAPDDAVEGAGVVLASVGESREVTAGLCCGSVGIFGLRESLRAVVCICTLGACSGKSWIVMAPMDVVMCTPCAGGPDGSSMGSSGLDLNIFPKKPILLMFLEDLEYQVFKKLRTKYDKC